MSSATTESTRLVGFFLICREDFTLARTPVTTTVSIWSDWVCCAACANAGPFVEIAAIAAAHANALRNFMICLPCTRSLPLKDTVAFITQTICDVRAWAQDADRYCLSFLTAEGFCGFSATAELSSAIGQSNRPAIQNFLQKPRLNSRMPAPPNDNPSAYQSLEAARHHCAESSGIAIVSGEYKPGDLLDGEIASSEQFARIAHSLS